MVRIFLLILICLLTSACQTPTGDPPSVSLVLKPGVGQVEAVWTPVPGAFRYRVEWTSGSSAPAGGSLETNQDSVTADGLVPGVDYTFTVTALSNGVPLARTTRHWASDGWSWESDPLVLGTYESTEANSYDLGGGDWIVFLTTSKITVEKLERLGYGPSGLTRTSWHRLTKTTGDAEPIVTVQDEKTATGQWDQLWAGFTAGTSERTSFTADRTSFTLESAPGVSWHLNR